MDGKAHFVTPTNRQLSEVRSGQLSLTPTSIPRGFAGMIAVDHWREFCAAFWLAVSPDGTYTSEVHLAVKTTGDWRDLTSGGGHGAGWPEPSWSPAVPAQQVQLGHLAGLTHPAGDGQEIDLVGRSGYAGSAVRGIAFVDDFGPRTIAVHQHLGAFVICAAAGDWTLCALDADGREIGDSFQVHQS